MVKNSLFLLLLFTLELIGSSQLHQRVESFIGKENYLKNRAFINIIFENERNFYIHNRVDDVKVVKTLKDNGLLHLFFDKPQRIEIKFSTNSNPLFFVKIMSDTLRGMGYYRYITHNASLDSSHFIWSIGLKSEYALDPIVLRNHLQKRGCQLEKIVRNSATSWEYVVDMRDAHLDVATIKASEIVEFNKSLYEHWLDVSHVKKISLWALSGSNWYPYITFYDRYMHLLKVYERDSKTYQITLKLPKDSAYVKIGDRYTLKNIKGGIRIKAIGER